MKDILGREVVVGDRIAYVTKAGGRIRRGQVIKRCQRLGYAADVSEYITVQIISDNRWDHARRIPLMRAPNFVIERT